MKAKNFHFIIISLFFALIALTTLNTNVKADYFNNTTKNGNISTGEMNVDADNFSDNFQLNGSASYLKPFLTLTPDTLWKVGVTTLKNKIDLNENFNLKARVNIGNKTSDNGGGDGIGFAFHTGKTTDEGKSGSGVGIAGLDNGIGFKLDTVVNDGLGYKDGQVYEDIWANDESHMDGIPKGSAFGAFVKDNENGKAFTYDPSDEYQARPQQINRYNNNQFKDFQLNYDPSTREITVNYDGHSWLKNINNFVKPGTRALSFSITSSTGMFSNLQQVQLDSFNYSAYGVSNIYYVNDHDENINDKYTQQIAGKVPNRGSFANVESNIKEIENSNGYYFNNVSSDNDSFDMNDNSVRFGTSPSNVKYVFNQNKTALDTKDIEVKADKYADSYNPAKGLNTATNKDGNRIDLSDINVSGDKVDLTEPGNYSVKYSIDNQKDSLGYSLPTVSKEANVKVVENQSQNGAIDGYEDGSQNKDKRDLTNKYQEYVNSYEDNYQKGKNDYNEGHKTGYEDGLAGKDEADLSNKNDGFKNGYLDGYQAGKNQKAKNDAADFAEGKQFGYELGSKNESKPDLSGKSDSYIDGVNQGWKQGHDEFSDAYKQGYEKGSNNQAKDSNEGKKDSFINGNNAGYEQGKSDFEEGQKAGYEDGNNLKDHADNSDKSSGYQIGYDNGYSKGKSDKDDYINEEYQSGEKAGYEKGSKNESAENIENKSEYYQTGYKKGHETGLNEYHVGYEKGKTDGEANNSKADISNDTVAYQNGYTAGYQKGNAYFDELEFNDAKKVGYYDGSINSDQRDLSNKSDEYQNTYKQYYDQAKEEFKQGAIVGENDGLADKEYNPSSDSTEAFLNGYNSTYYINLQKKHDADYEEGRKLGQYDAQNGFSKKDYTNSSDSFKAGYEYGYNHSIVDYNQGTQNALIDFNNKNTNHQNDNAKNDQVAYDNGYKTYLDKLKNDDAEYQKGFAAGKNDGYNNKSFADLSNKSDSFKKGYKAGYEKGKAALNSSINYDYYYGKQAGLNDAKNGKLHANNNNYSTAYQNGYDDGYKEGLTQQNVKITSADDLTMTLRYVDTKGNKIQSDKVIKVNKNADFNVYPTPVSRYSYLGVLSGAIKGKMVKDQTVTFMYKKSDALVIKKSSTVFAKNKIKFYKDKNMKHVKHVYKKAKSITNSPMFVVKHILNHSKGYDYYYVKDVNHKSKTAGMKGYIYASENVDNVYYKTNDMKTLKVINNKGINAYKNVNLTKKVKHYKKGQKIKIVSVEKHNLTTRFKLSNGTYITANKKLIKKERQ